MQFSRQRFGLEHGRMFRSDSELAVVAWDYCDMKENASGFPNLLA